MSENLKEQKNTMKEKCLLENNKDYCNQQQKKKGSVHK